MIVDLFGSQIQGDVIGAVQWRIYRQQGESGKVHTTEAQKQARKLTVKKPAANPIVTEPAKKRTQQLRRPLPK